MSAQELAQLRGLLSQGGIDFSADPVVERVNFDGMFGSFPKDETLVTTAKEFGGVPGLWADGERGVLLYLHGGGYTLGSAKAYEQFAASLARSADVALFSVDYRLAPEHPYPAAIDDAVAAYRGLLAGGIPSTDIVIVGDSAGGGLTLAALVALRDAGEALPSAAVVLSPFADLTFSGGSMTGKAERDPALTESGLRDAAAHYLQGADPSTPSASPVFAELLGLPPLLVEVGQDEILLSDSVRIAERAAENGVDVTLHVWPTMIHDWAVFSFMLSEGRDLIDEVGAWVRSRLAAVTGEGA